MATFVLVHGAWLGGWCWKYVAPELRPEGHDVYTPTLTGLGEREHLARPEVDLETHVTDVVNAIEYEDLDDVILVGHSYGGLVATGVIDRVPERIARVVYLDAMTPMGDRPTSVFDLGPPAYREMVDAEADEHGDGWRWPIPEEPDGWVGISEPDDRWLRSKAVPQPVGTFSQPVAVRNSTALELPFHLRPLYRERDGRINPRCRPRDGGRARMGPPGTRHRPLADGIRAHRRRRGPPRIRVIRSGTFELRTYRTAVRDTQ